MMGLSYGNWAYAAGTAGTVTLPVGAYITHIYARSTAGGSIVIFGGNTIPIVAATDFYRDPVEHSLMVAKTGANTIVFTTTTSYYVEYVSP